MTSTDDAALATKGESTRKSILDAAIARFGTDGYRATSVADIARDADVSGSLAYAYFDGKEGLFIDALDHDVAELINTGVLTVLDTAADGSWRETLFFTLLEELEKHPLARRVLAGLEPRVTDRMIMLPALEELRSTLADRLRNEQQLGTIRSDIDPGPTASGFVSIYVTLLLATVQFGSAGIEQFGSDVMQVLANAIEPIEG